MNPRVMMPKTLTSDRKPEMYDHPTGLPDPVWTEILQIGLKEDIGFGDLATDALLSERHVRGSFLSRDTGILSGLQVLKKCYDHLGGGVDIDLFLHDGERIREGETIATVEGPASVILTGERLILNLLQHMSGIATATARGVEILKGSGIRLCDTRKTLPGLRAFQKYAVRCGGGFNHRLRLDDGLMIKENHIAVAGSIQRAVKRARDRAGLMVRIEVECETEEQVDEAVSAATDVIMLDNCTPEQAARMRNRIPDSILVELSGGVTLENLGIYRECGVDYISMGALTHSVRAFDISFLLEDIGEYHG